MEQENYIQKTALEVIDAVIQKASINGGSVNISELKELRKVIEE